jgi:uncharacterized membrane protein YeaQ/YmgE (transglycosylase-associated protein family)
MKGGIIMLGFILTLIIAALAGWIGDALVKNDMPGGFWGALLAGIVGSWIGAYIPFFNVLGPKVWGVAIIPTILGAAIFIFVLGLFKRTAKQAR